MKAVQHNKIKNLNNSSGFISLKVSLRQSLTHVWLFILRLVNYSMFGSYSAFG